MRVKDGSRHIASLRDFRERLGERPGMVNRLMAECDLDAELARLGEAAPRARSHHE